METLTPGMGSTAEDGDGFGQIEDLKRVYLYLVREVERQIDREVMFDADHQQFMSSLADVAIEIFATESTFLRVAKHRNGNGSGALGESLATIYFERAVGRVRQEAREILSALFEGEKLRTRLDDVEGWLPLPVGLVATRKDVARVMLETGGTIS